MKEAEFYSERQGRPERREKPYIRRGSLGSYFLSTIVQSLLTLYGYGVDGGVIGVTPITQASINDDDVLTQASIDYQGKDIDGGTL